MDIYKIRAELGLSREQFAKKIGVRRETIWLWETGKAKPSPLAMFAIKDFMDKQKERNLDYSDRQKKFIEDYVDCPIPEEVRRILGYPREEFCEILGCTLSEYIGWIAEGKSVPFYYKKFMKFLLKKKKEGKL